MLFSPLSHDEVRQIARHYLSEITTTLGRSGKTFEIDPDALERIVEQGYSLAFGARFLKRVIDERIKLPISKRWHDGVHFHARLVDGEVVVEPSPAPRLLTDPALAYGDVA